MRNREQKGSMARRRFLHRGLWAGIGALVGRLFFDLRQRHEPGSRSGRAGRDRPRDSSELAG